VGGVDDEHRTDHPVSSLWLKREQEYSHLCGINGSQGVSMAMHEAVTKFLKQMMQKEMMVIMINEMLLHYSLHSFL